MSNEKINNTRAAAIMDGPDGVLNSKEENNPINTDNNPPIIAKITIFCGLSERFLAIAVGLVVIGFLTFIRFDIMGLLFGDILAVNKKDLVTIWVGGALILLVLRLIWKPLFASTVNYELAQAEGLNPDRAKAIFTILLAAIIAISIKLVGVLLITGMLIIPTAMARNLSDNPQKMVIFAIIGGLLSVFIGPVSYTHLTLPTNREV